MPSPTPNLSDHEVNDLPFWARHHKGNVAYLVVRIKQLLDGSEEQQASVESILRATLEEFAKSAGVNLDEVKLK